MVNVADTHAAEEHAHSSLGVVVALLRAHGDMARGLYLRHHTVTESLLDDSS